MRKKPFTIIFFIIAFVFSAECSSVAHSFLFTIQRAAGQLSDCIENAQSLVRSGDTIIITLYKDDFEAIRPIILADSAGARSKIKLLHIACCPSNSNEKNEKGQPNRIVVFSMMFGDTSGSMRLPQTQAVSLGSSPVQVSGTSKPLSVRFSKGGVRSITTSRIAAVSQQHGTQQTLGQVNGVAEAATSKTNASGPAQDQTPPNAITSSTMPAFATASLSNLSSMAGNAPPLPDALKFALTSAGTQPPYQAPDRDPNARQNQQMFQQAMKSFNTSLSDNGQSDAAKQFKASLGH